MAHPNRPSERNLLLAFYILNGKSLATAGEIFGLTGSRVRQIIHKVCLYLRPDLVGRFSGTSGHLSIKKMRYAHVEGDSMMDDLVMEALMYWGGNTEKASTQLHLKSQVSRLRLLLGQKERELSVTESQRKHLAVRLSGLDRNEAQIQRFAAHNVVMRKTLEAIRKELDDSDIMTQQVHDK